MKTAFPLSLWLAAVLAGFGALDLCAQQTVRPYAVEVAQDTPFGWWRMGDAPPVPPAEDTGSGNHDGQYIGAVSAAPGIPAAADGAGDFGGGHIDVPNPADFDSAGAALTVEAWVQPDAGGAFRWLIAKDNDNTSLDYLLGINTADSFLFITQGLGNVAAGPVQAFDGITWYHVVGVQDPAANTVRLYVNGVQAASVPLAVTGVKASNRLRLGARGVDAAQAIDGRIDEVALYKAVLSDERILAHYNEGVGGANYAAVVAADNPYGWWRLGDAPTGGDVVEGADSGSGGNSGVYSGGVLAGPGIPGTSDGAADFTAGRLTISNPTAFDIGGADMTVEAWVQPDGSGTFRWMVSKDDDNTALDYLLGSNPNGGLRFIAQGLSNDIQAPGLPVIDGLTWHHVVGVIDTAGGVARLYVDGEEVASRPLAASTGVLAANPLVIGDRSGFGGNQTVDGRIDEVAIYKTTLTPERIRAHYLAGIFTTDVSISILRQPSSVLTAAGFSASFSVNAIKQGTDLPLLYQWQRNGANISGATSNVYIIPRTTLADNAVQFRVVVSLAGGLSLTSDAATLTVIPSVGSYESEVTSDQPFGWWRLGDAPKAAVAADSGSGGHSGPYSGLIAAAPGIPGAADGSADFMGGNIDVNDPAAFNFGGAALTVEAWFQPDAFGAFGWIAGKDNDNTSLDFLLGHNADGRFRFITQGLANDALAVDPVAADGSTWYHVVGVQDPASGSVRLYVNAAEVANVPLAATGVFSTTKLRIGARGAAAAQRVDGRLDEVAIYAAALTPAQIEAHYTAGNQGPDYAAVVAADQPLGWWRFGDAPVETEPDPAQDSGSGGHQGIYSGNVRAATGIPGSFDGGADFGGGRVTIEEPAAFDSGGGDLTVEAWVQPDGSGSFRWMVAKDDDNTALDYLLGSNPTGQFRFITQGLANDIFAPTVPPLNGQNWFHVVGVQDTAQNRVSLYVNAELVALTPIAATGVTASSPLVIGDRSSGGGGQTVDGRIDEVAIYKSVLSLERIRAHYVAGTKPLLAIERDGANVVLLWGTGVLEAADNITGPWNAVANATSPFTVTPGGARKFYRVRQ